MAKWEQQLKSWVKQEEANIAYLHKKYAPDWYIDNTQPINKNSVEIDGIDKADYPDMCDSYFSYAEFIDGTPLTDDQLDKLTDDYREECQEIARERAL